jgi:hypothetical protein
LKKLLAIGAVMALVGVMAAPMAALAADTVVTGTVAEKPTITSVLTTTGGYDHAGAGTIPVTITGTNFVMAQPATVAIATGAGTAVTVGAVTVASVTSITTTFIIAVDSAASARAVTVTVAGKTSTEIVNFTVDGSITVVAPTGGSLGYLTAGATKTATLTAGTVTTNSAVWQVSAVDAKLAAIGYMNTQADGNGTSLSQKFQMSKTTGGYLDADQPITYDETSDTSKTLPLSISQTVATDAPAGTYQITITFAGSPS